jgi:SagB-type dehydrogenase family enzyme
MYTGLTVVAAFLTLMGGMVSAQTLDTIKLPAPALKEDKPFMQVIKERKSSREFADKELSLQDLANVLWCANGVNRPESGHRTAPSAMNKQDIEVYAVLKNGVYLYDATKHVLIPVAAGDFRKETGMQEFVATAPLNLVYVSDFAKFDMVKERADKVWMASLDAGHCSQNVYLYGADAGLGVVVRASVDKAKMAGTLKLKDTQEVMIAQTVGYPK